MFCELAWHKLHTFRDILLQLLSVHLTPRVQFELQTHAFTYRLLWWRVSPDWLSIRCRTYVHL